MARTARTIKLQGFARLSRLNHVQGVEALRTSLDTIRFATNRFCDVFEQGAFGKVYKGELSRSKGKNSVIVMQLDPGHMKDSYGQDFCKKIEMLYNYNHKNLIPLVGFCEEESERIVVFEHMVNGSVKEYLRSTSLTWKERLKICVDAAKGIAHIHSGVENQHLIHGDVKSSSILLDHEMKAVISDFIIPESAGTIGYYDPLNELRGRSQKSDVYSFGVVMFEILSGRLAIERLKNDNQHQVVFLARLAAQCFINQQLDEVIFQDIKGKIEGKSLDIFVLN
ncbi:receptor-like protein kinase HERK 1 [Rutidosis leptorrhynchoides]|uniref:receptor-like protein kinase HERK 1 n=1 Tax=Rutidosis leptorrhynchoides TaxID=125765 RepID=UPI003A99AEFC